jgi:4-amino-4-deoxy-L-arabinose transferase-like glycosyltransferase
VTSAQRAWKEAALLALVVSAAFAVRIYRLGDFPDTVLADEADNAQSAIYIVYGHPPGNGFFGFDWTPQPAMSVYKEAAFLAVLGFNIAAMRLPSALMSALALIPFYILLRRQLSALASFLATILLATSLWYLNFSRSGWNNIDVCFYMLMAMLCLMWALDGVKSSAAEPWAIRGRFAVAGFCCALGLYAYPSGRAITLAVLAFFPIAVLCYRQQVRTVALGYAVLVGVELLVFAPEAVYVAKNWAFFNGRSNVVLILNSPTFKADPRATMLRQVENNLLGPWVGRVNNTPQYTPVGEPQLDQISGALAFLGMILTLAVVAFRRRGETWLWWLMLVSGWTLTQVLTTNTPNGARGVGYMPTYLYFAGIGIEGIVRTIASDGSGMSRAVWARRVSIPVSVALVLAAGYANVAHYVAWQSNPQTRQARYLYVTSREFPEWSEAIVDRATEALGATNVGLWREAHPILDRANP